MADDSQGTRPAPDFNVGHLHLELIESNNLALAFAATLIVLGVLSTFVATRFGAPLLLFFLGIGLLMGEDGPGGVQFHDFQRAHLVGSVALAIILFDGGLRTRVKALRAVFAPAGLLATGGVLVTALVVAVAAMLLLNLTFVQAFLLGAIVASTDAAAVFFLMRTGGLRLKRRVNDTLEVESGTNDPFAVFLVIALVQWLSQGGQFGAGIALVFVEQMVIGTLLGLGGGFLMSLTLNRAVMPPGLNPVFVAGAALLLFALTNLLNGSGFLAAYLAGLVLANRPTRAVAAVTSFTDAATWLAQIIMFVLLGLLATPHRLPELLVPALGIAVVLIFIARPIAVVMCLYPFRFRWSEKAFVSWVGLRGAVAIFLAILPLMSSLPNGLLYFDVAFVVVLASLILQGWTVRHAANFLRVSLPGADHPESRVELDLPGQMEQELVGYPVRPDSAFLRAPRAPGWAKLVLVVRGDAILLPSESGDVRAGDYVYFLAPPIRASGLDRLFAETETDRVAGEIYFGEFTVNGATQLSEIATLYAPGTPHPSESVADAFAHAFGVPAPGDTISLGDIELVAKTMEDDRVLEAGLRLEPEPVSEKVRRLVRRVPAFRKT